MNILNVDWQSVFLPQASPLEVIVRGTVIYLTLLSVHGLAHTGPHDRINWLAMELCLSE